MGPVELREYATSLGLGDRQDPEVYLPTAEQIRLATAAIRSGWTQTERESRLVGQPPARIKEATGPHNHARRDTPDDRDP